MGVAYNWTKKQKQSIVKSYVNSNTNPRKIAERYLAVKLIDGGKYEIIGRNGFNPKKHLFIVNKFGVSKTLIVNILKEFNVWENVDIQARVILNKLKKANEYKQKAEKLLDEVYDVAMIEIEPLVKQKRFIDAYKALTTYFYGDFSECMQKFDIVSFIYDSENK